MQFYKIECHSYRSYKINYFYIMIIEISEKKMKKVGELVFESFNRARMYRRSCRLTAKMLVDEGIIPNRQKLYAV